MKDGDRVHVIRGEHVGKRGVVISQAIHGGSANHVRVMFSALERRWVYCRNLIIVSAVDRLGELA